MSDHLIRHVLDTVHREFHSWELEYSLQTIRSFSKPRTSPNVKSKPNISEKSRQNASLFCEIQDFEPTTTNCTVKSVDIIQIPRRLLLQPTPAYESSPLIPRNRMTGDDSSNMPFIPMADDVNFDWQDHCKKYKSFAWQTSMKDPDCPFLLHQPHSADRYTVDIVLLEAARRLNEEHGISYESIDASGIFPEKLLTGPGLLIRASRRCGFPRCSLQLSNLAQRHAPVASRSKASISTTSESRCPKRILEYGLDVLFQSQLYLWILHHTW